MRIGVFDSGVGGQSIADAIKTALPNYEIILREDKKNVPYGTKTPEEILSFIMPIFQSMVDDGCQIIVVACNTVTTTLIQDLRQAFDVPMVAVEPMIKPASEMTRSKIIAVCATPTTLASRRYKELKHMHADEIEVLEPDCSDWALMIEGNQIDHLKIAERIQEVLTAGADVIVLACTHFHWIEADVKQLVGSEAKVLQPEPAIIEQLKRVISRLG